MHIQNLITHSGAFHTDEVMSTVILKALFPAAEIIRTRDNELIAPAADRIVYDVGGLYDPQAQIFDHHQRGGPERESGARYSSFGLIWKHYGLEYLTGPCGASPELADQLHKRLDSKFVAKIDMVDNGELQPSSAGLLSKLLFTSMIENFTPSFDDDRPEAMDEAFVRAVDFASAAFQEEVRKQESKIRAIEVALKDIEASGDSPLLIMSRGMPFSEALRISGKDHFLFVIAPRPDSTWTIGTIRVKDDSFEDKVKLPEAWAGLKDAELAKATGVSDAVFCHIQRFMAVAGSRDGIMEMARQAIAGAEAQAR